MYFSVSYDQDLYTLPETNITPENRPSRKESSLPTTIFQVQIVSFRDGTRPREVGRNRHPFVYAKRVGVKLLNDDKSLPIRNGG